MSSDSERLHKPSKRRRPIVSDSDNSEDSFINMNRGKRKVNRIVIEGDSSDDDSDVPSRPVQKKKNHKLIIEDESSYDSSSSNQDINFDSGSTSSEWQSDWESMDESTSEAVGAAACKPKCKKSPNKSLNKTQSDSSSEHSDGESEKCPICLLSFRKQEIGNPTVCDHCFCLECIVEWSKNMNTCPVDRQNFDVINVRETVGGKILRYVPVEVRQQTEEVVQEDPTYCEICMQCTREDRMLLCDGCDSGYHLECLDPPMEEVPLDEHWYCPECSRNTQNDAEDIEIDLDELPDLIEEARQLGHSYGRSRAYLAAQERGVEALSTSGRVRRGNLLLPRTRQAERVRANVRAVRTRRAAAEAAALAEFIFEDVSGRGSSSSSSPLPGPSSSSSGPSTSRATGTSASSSSRSVRRDAHARKTTSSRKVKKKKTSKRKKSRRAVGDGVFREVRITEVNENGELEETVEYVRAGPAAAAGSRRKKKKRKKGRVRTVASLKTAKRRIATQLKILGSSRASLGNGGAVQLTPTLKNEPGFSSANSQLRAARHQAGIAQVSLFGAGLGLDYSPPGDFLHLAIANPTRSLPMSNSV